MSSWLCKGLILKQGSVLSFALQLLLVFTWCLYVSHSPPFSLPLLSVSVPFSASVTLLLSSCHVFVFSFPADARCECDKGRRRFRAEVFRGDVGRGAQPGTHRATDTHGRGQSIHISVELILRVFVNVENPEHPSIPKSVFFSFPSLT